MPLPAARAAAETEREAGSLAGRRGSARSLGAPGGISAPLLVGCVSVDEPCSVLR